MLAHVGSFLSEISSAELILFLIGAVLGIFYGFDGWRGSLKDIDYKKSPRVKHFVWVVGIGFTTFIADIKRLDPNLDKERLLAAYIIGFVLCAGCVILGWAIGIYFTFLRIRVKEPTKWPGPPFSPLADYLQYGYRYLREQYKEALEKKAVREDQYFRLFVPYYVKQISYMIAAVDAARGSQMQDIARNILNSICAVVIEYYGRVQDLEVNANYMVAHDRSVLPQLESRLKCAFGDRKRYAFFLALECYATDTDTSDFVLPVEDKRDKENKSRKRSLPGAPLAFLMNQTVIIDDVSKIKYGNMVPDNIKEEEQSLLEGKKFKSFGCLNIVRDGKQLGIVNVESNKPCVFGRTPEAKREITALLHPFCLLLGRVIKSEAGAKNV